MTACAAGRTLQRNIESARPAYSATLRSYTTSQDATYRFGGMTHRDIAARLSLDLETVERCIGHVLATMVRFSDGDMTVPPLHPMVAEAEARQLRKGASDGHK